MVYLNILSCLLGVGMYLVHWGIEFATRVF